MFWDTLIVKVIKKVWWFYLKPLDIAQKSISVANFFFSTMKEVFSSFIKDFYSFFVGFLQLQVQVQNP
jgi:hypothetical protein